MQPVLVFLSTFFIELIVYFTLIKKEVKENIILYCFLINAFTWPLANLFYGFFNLFWIIELGVFLVEFVLIKSLFRIEWKKALLISFIANLITTFIGYLWMVIFRVYTSA
ncbi:MAG: hypothetical protein Q7S33_04320 [Nanoarchaeota archaeon]|nr:hypothetical protein [Nanoarchaeota archaeon]